MLLKNRKSWLIAENQVTPERLYLSRRQIMQGFGVGLGAAMAGPLFRAGAAYALPEFEIAKKTNYAGEEELNSYKEITSYNNYYEFGVDKEDPAKYAHTLITDPWPVTVTGHAERTGTFSLEDLIDFNALEERIYRLRCVEAWSMVIPWVGVPLAGILKKFEPTSKAKFVAFETLADRAQMPGLRSRVLDWPYREGLRMDEAMHPLAFMAVGLYGKPLLGQNGAPMRLVVPWKYGFKSIKSIVQIRFTEKQPRNTWNILAPHEYGFYANVNPAVSHPRWSQASERRLPTSLFNQNRIPTRLFNGYGEEVASLYAGMNLRRNF
ncbi:MAG: protein-methionine-sulfoxide reductase catalytic subunit MsrP [Proteobacteria bacterium]|nr:protein-methionine-sulfoxide reductase catalytic subunit MsrP [Pseudomonadota bacterium]